MIAKSCHLVLGKYEFVELTPPSGSDMYCRPDYSVCGAGWACHNVFTGERYCHGMTSLKEAMAAVGLSYEDYSPTKLQNAGAVVGGDLAKVLE